MCLKFTPNDTNICNEISVLGDWGGEGAPYYDLGIGSYLVRLELVWELYQNIGLEDKDKSCVWRVSLIYVNPVNHEAFLISATDYEIAYSYVTCDDPYGDAVGDSQTCQNPYFTFTELIPFEGCEGVFTISRYEMERVPFRKVTFEPPTSEQDIYPSPCAERLKVCTHVCVRYYIGDDLVSRDFKWSDEAGVWQRGSDTIGLSENSYGLCVISPNIAGLGVIDQEDLIVRTPIGVGLLFETTGSTYLAISCNPCECWKRICGNCRCICKTLCVAHSDGSVEGTVYEELAWDDARGGWGDYNYFIGLEDNGYGGCQVRVPDYDDPIQVYECGRGLAFFQERSDVGKFVSAGCKACTCGRPAGCCGDIPLPAILYADVTSRPYDEYDTAHVHPCFNALSVPLFYIPHGVQEELIWMGYFNVDNGCGVQRFRITLYCLGGDTGPYGEGLGEFRATITAILGISSGEVLFPSLIVTDCSPFMVGDDSWGVIGGMGLPGIGGPEFSACIECSYGISLRVVE